MPALDRPLFRHDHLIAEVVEDGGNKFVDVHDPDSGNLYRLYEVEYALACGMDGQRDVAGIVKWAQDELGLTPSPSEVQAVISTLSGLRFVSSAEEGKAVAAELAPGIIVSKPAAAAVAATTKGVDVELGHSGAPAAARAADELPKADFDLGAPGATAKPVAAAAAAKVVDDIALGAPGVRPEAVKQKGPPSEVSIDLADHLSIKPSDVKEAVRASKVMQAVDVPKDLLEADAAAEKAAAAAKAAAAEKAAAEKAAADKAAADKAAADKAAADKAAADKAAAEKAAAAKTAADKAAADKAAAEKAAAAKAAAAAEKKPVELPKQPEKKPEERAKSVAPPAPSTGPSPALVIFLILVVVGAGAFFAWKYIINKPEATPPAPKAEVPPPPPPAPPAPTGMIKVAAPPAAELEVAVAGTIETIEPADKDVKTGDTIAWLEGAKALQDEVTKLTADVEKLQPAVTEAETALSAEQQKENNEAGVKAAQKKLDAAKKPLDVKKSALTLKQGELDKLAVKSTNDGKLAEPVAAGTKLEANAVVAKVVQPAAATVSFKLPPGVKLPADGSVNVAGTGAPIACKVVDAQADSINVTCPTDASLADGSTVTLALTK